ncbi:coatomer protein gamma sub-unit [Cyclospora cayetanensis]|uniref:Coatomer protein gamma sub-unit n=1 Tax=Cyclospora cayetanensis TaxID=88456 RepID=A0A1D3CUZ2_9EIME|nr:coatomer protein gamma sub-unit [Cyclospora cayetanensis]
MLSQVFILSPRGDCLISRDFRRDVPRGAAEIFLRKVRFWGQQQQQEVSATSDGSPTVAAGSEAPPVFTVGGLSFAFLRRSGLLFVLVTQQNPSPSLLIEVLLRIVKAIKVAPLHCTLHCTVYRPPTHVLRSFLEKRCKSQS